MARKANPALIGAFVLGAVVLAVAGLVILGGGKLFRQKQSWVANFDEAIKGLAIGAPVMFKGVKVGAVTDIKVVVDRKADIVTTPVYFDIEADRFTDAAGGTFQFRTKEAAGTKHLIATGLRAQLELQSLVTGQLTIELDFHPGTPVRLVGVGPGEHEMPTIPSSSERLSKALDKLPIDQIAASTLSALQGIDRLANDADLKKALVALPRTLGSVEDAVRRVSLNADRVLADVGTLTRNIDSQIGPLASGLDATLGTSREAIRDVQTLVRNVDGQVGPLITGVEKTLGGAAVAMEEARRVLSAVDELVADGSPLQTELLVVLRDLSMTARSIRALSDYVERHPESLVFGKDPARGR
jgi:paraquat-inducible protein B